MAFLLTFLTVLFLLFGVINFCLGIYCKLVRIKRLRKYKDYVGAGPLSDDLFRRLVATRSIIHMEITFTYTKADGEVSDRHVVVAGIKDRKIYAFDDKQMKSFLVSRMSNVELL